MKIIRIILRMEVQLLAMMLASFDDMDGILLGKRTKTETRTKKNCCVLL